MFNKLFMCGRLYWQKLPGADGWPWEARQPLLCAAHSSQSGAWVHQVSSRFLLAGSVATCFPIGQVIAVTSLFIGGGTAQLDFY